jgi:hypothetical protein
MIKECSGNSTLTWHSKVLRNSHPQNRAKRVGNLGTQPYKLKEVIFCSQKLTALYLQGTGR